MKPLAPDEIAAIDARFANGETVWMWLIHHGIACEPLTEPLSARIAYINGAKPEAECETRLRWLQLVRDVDRLPREWLVAACVQWGAASSQAEGVRWDDARVQWEAACVQWEAAYATHAPALLAHLRDEMPGCPFDGQTLFPNGGTP